MLDLDLAPALDRIMHSENLKFSVFLTAIGWCGLAWSEHGLIGFQLPEADKAQTHARLSQRFPSAVEALPDSYVDPVVEAIIALTNGEARDLTLVDLDTEGCLPFSLGVYAIARSIPPGRTRTYGEIAAELGDRNAARAVGRALGENPWPIIVPCHRVLAAGGKIGGFSANGGAVTKAKLLAIENAHTGAEPTLFDDMPTFSLAPKRG